MQALDSLSSHTHNLISVQQHFLLWAHQLVRFSIKLLVSRLHNFKSLMFAWFAIFWHLYWHVQLCYDFGDSCGYSMYVWTKFGYMIWAVYLERDGKHAWAVLKYLNKWVREIGIAVLNETSLSCNCAGCVGVFLHYCWSTYCCFALICVFVT